MPSLCPELTILEKVTIKDTIKGQEYRLDFFNKALTKRAVEGAVNPGRERWRATSLARLGSTPQLA